MRSAFTIVLLFFYFTNYAQQKIVHDPIDELNRIEKNDNRDGIYSVVEIMPSFPGGNDSLKEYIVKHLVYPHDAKQNGIEGKVYTTFIVETDGSITHVEIIRGLGYGCDEEAIRLIKSFPIWVPGIENGKPVRVRFKYPIRFLKGL